MRPLSCSPRAGQGASRLRQHRPIGLPSADHRGLRVVRSYPVRRLPMPGIRQALFFQLPLFVLLTKQSWPGGLRHWGTQSLGAYTLRVLDLTYLSYAERYKQDGFSDLYESRIAPSAYTGGRLWA